MLLERSTIWVLPGISFPNHEITRNEVYETRIRSQVSFIYSTFSGVPSDPYWPRPLLSDGALSLPMTGDRRTKLLGKALGPGWRSALPRLLQNPHSQAEEKPLVQTSQGSNGSLSILP